MTHTRDPLELISDVQHACHIKNFICELKKESRCIRGFNGVKLHNIYKGTIKWFAEDDNGTVCELIIPDSFYVPNGEHRLISPQHWAQTLRKNTSDNDVSCVTKWNKSI